MKLAIKKWGNSAAIRLPASLLDSLHIKINSEVNVNQKNGRIIITPISRKYHLNDLLNAITPDNCHTEISFGEPVGKEEL